MPDVPNIDIRPDHWQIVRHILRLRVPQYAVWAFGSRAKWTAKQYSDLDLAIITDEPLSLSVSASLADDFSESDLPWKVDVVDWANTSESFRKIIERDKVVVQKPVMASEWREVQLGDVAGLMTGYPFKSQHYTDDVDAPRLIGGDNIAQGNLRWDSVRRWPRDMTSGLDDYWLEPGDVVLAMDRPWIEAGLKRAAVGQHDVPALLIQRTARLRGTTELDTAFLRYVVGSQAFTQYILSVQTGTAVPHISPAQIRAFRFPLPPPEEQRAIAETLGALDDRIDNLRQTNATLGAIAAALFKSRFVDFDGVPQEDMQESELGLIPKGWRVGTLGDVLSLRNERTQPSKETAALTYVPIESIGAKNPFLSDWMGGENANSSLILFKRGDILFGAMRPYFHKVCIAPFDGVTRTTVFTLKPTKPEFSAYALMLAYQDETIEWATSHSEGSTIPYAKWKNSFERMPVVLPPEDVRVRFGDIVSPLIEKANANIQQAATLANLRDTLLPRLISGQLRVKDAERIAETA